MAEQKSQEDIEEGLHSVDDVSDESQSFSDAEDRSWYSPNESRGGSLEEYRFSNVSDLEIGGVSDPNRNSVSDCCSEVDLEHGAPEIKVHLAKAEKDCRICHLSLESANQECGVPIVLGCSCKNDLAAAHKQCAEAWFKIKGNKTCEICGSTARNVVGTDETEFMDQWNDTNNVLASPPTEHRSFCHGHRFLNFLLAFTSGMIQGMTRHFGQPKMLLSQSCDVSLLQRHCKL